MKTIQIPLELAEELLSSLRDIARHNCKVFGIPDTTTEHYLSENYHKLKKLVEEQTSGTVEKHENGETYRVWRLPLKSEQGIKESIKDVVEDLKEKGELYRKLHPPFNSREEHEEYNRIKTEYFKTEMPRFPNDLLPD